MMQGTAVLMAIAAGGIVAILSSSPDGQAARGPEATTDAPTDRGILSEISSELLSTAAAATPRVDIERVVEVKRGDTFIKLMRGAGVPNEDAHAAVVAMQTVFDPRELRPGQRITLTFRPDNGAQSDDQFVGLRFDPTVERAIRVERAEDGFAAEAVDRELDRRAARLSGSIESNLYTDGTSAGLPAAKLVELIRLFSWDVDFQRDIQKGDRFDVMIERLHRKDGRVARYGDILYAELVLSGVSHRLYRYESEAHGVDYYDDKGQSARKALLRTPVDGARLSSTFGNRRHPILGYTKMHRGVDFAAPTGTPIYAAGRGTIEMIGRNGAYGNYIRIRHNDRYATAYAHMSRFARGLKRGSRVKQGEVIGYIGTTGRSTGPHLHYEVFAQGAQVNPLTVKLPSGHKLQGKELAAFRTVRGDLVSQLATTESETRISRSVEQ